MKQKIIDLIKKFPFISKRLILFFLNLHQTSYKMVGLLSSSQEEDDLHPKHRLMKYHDWFVEEIDPSWRVLDVGCGVGALASDLAKKANSVTGIDFGKNNIEKAKSRYPNINFISGDATQYQFDNQFDVIVLSNVLEHIESRVDFLKKLSNVSNRFLIRVPMIDRDWITLYKKDLGLEYRLDSTHFTEYTEKQFQEEMKSSGLKIQKSHIRFGEIFAVVEKQ